jgi:hypothetical protein
VKNLPPRHLSKKPLWSRIQAPVIARQHLDFMCSRNPATLFRAKLTLFCTKFAGHHHPTKPDCTRTVTPGHRRRDAASQTEPRPTQPDCLAAQPALCGGCGVLREATTSWGVQQIKAPSTMAGTHRRVSSTLQGRSSGQRIHRHRQPACLRRSRVSSPQSAHHSHPAAGPRVSEPEACRRRQPYSDRLAAFILVAAPYGRQHGGQHVANDICV